MLLSDFFKKKKLSVFINDIKNLIKLLAKLISIYILNISNSTNFN